MGKILEAIRHRLDVHLFRHDMANHCPHQPVGSCSETCDFEVLADRW